MKLTIECLTQFSHQDKIDLSKIWPHQNLERLQQNLNVDRRLFVARFNDRLLAAVIVEVKGEYAELSDLLVREATRRRGVGLYLINEVRNQLPGVKEWWLATADHAAVKEEVLAKFMISCGFSPVSGGWRYTHNQD